MTAQEQLDLAIIRFDQVRTGTATTMRAYQEAQEARNDLLVRKLVGISKGQSPTMQMLRAERKLDDTLNELAGRLSTWELERQTVLRRMEAVAWRACEAITESPSKE